MENKKTKTRTRANVTPPIRYCNNNQHERPAHYHSIMPKRSQVTAILLVQWYLLYACTVCIYAILRACCCCGQKPEPRIPRVLNHRSGDRHEQCQRLHEPGCRRVGKETTSNSDASTTCPESGPKWHLAEGGMSAQPLPSSPR